MWVVLAGVGVWLTYVASTDDMIAFAVGGELTDIFVVTGLTNVVLYVIARHLASQQGDAQRCKVKV